MKVAISAFEAILGAWLIVTPWLFGYATLANKLVDVCLGAVALIVALVYFSKNKNEKPLDEKMAGAHKVIVAIGVILVVEGIVGLAAFGYTAGAGANEIVVGIVLAAIACFANQLLASKKVVMSGEDGGELVTITKLDYKNGILVMKAKAFGTMPMVVHVEPKQLWLLIGFLSYGVVSHLPGILAKGNSEAHEADSKVAAKKGAQAA